MLVDTFMADRARDDFAQRQELIQEAARFHGFTADNSLAIGGGALALHNLDTYAPNFEGFDFDVVRVEPRPARMSQRWLDALLKDDFVVLEGGPLPTTVISGGHAEYMAQELFPYRSVDNMFAHRVPARGLSTPPPLALARGKAAADRFKDHIGFIKAQVVATAQEHPIVDEPAWKTIVCQGIQHMAPDILPMLRRYDRYAWIGELITRQFDHPALRSLYNRAARENSYAPASRR